MLCHVVIITQPRNEMTKWPKIVQGPGHSCLNFYMTDHFEQMTKSAKRAKKRKKEKHRKKRSKKSRRQYEVNFIFNINI